ncbi:molybdopterin molybdotransferase MoeA [Nitrincola tapanii]|uniref:Molybdopterin molybdenumtransferase n=1 Tax=Nitrincola tapanii TaxID=1708751 RepID=A0A5A9W3K7_9GAMM|nr:gephyrin-like molybdotransferase Glp [Nitrincola tapanii]KAA0875074.1 molybdopterin molybdotransferase MoeA [Nitrincola tapanii]
MPKPLRPVDEALQAMLAQFESLQNSNSSTSRVRETCVLSQALGRVLAVAVQAELDVPPCDNSAMDGYALRVSDAPGPLPVSQRVAAGQAPQPLLPGTCARIFTGAPIPAGADTVVMQEKISLTAFEDILFPADLVPGNNIRRAGQDVVAGTTLLTPGVRLDARHLGLLASIGWAEVEVYRPVRVAILSTGDELVSPGQALAPGQIYNSNAPLLQGLLSEWGAEVVSVQPVEDSFAATCQALTAAAQQADLIISTGGVSVGEEDHIKPAVEALGGLEVWRLAMKPGKPLAIGYIGQTPFIGLPGNPVSTYVGAQVFVRPAVQQLSGATPESPRLLQGIAQFRTRTEIRQEYLRVQAVWRDQAWQLEAFANQNSGVLTSVVWANALAVIPPGQCVQPGDRVTFFLL